MKLYEVIPIANVLGRETLSYFGTDSIGLGSLVSIPLRKKVVNAIVVGKQDVGKEKSNIKSSSFALRKIGSLKSPHFLSESFLNATLETARYHATNTGAVLQTLLPQAILSLPAKKNHLQINSEIGIRKEHLVIQSEDEERFSHYRGFIRGEFARHSSVYFALPTIEDIRSIKKELEKGIEQYTAVLHSGLSKKEFLAQIKIINNTSHPVLIIGTIPFLSVERADIQSIILDRENSRSYRTLSRPFINLRTFVEKFATHSNRKLILGDILLSTETLWKLKNDECAEFSPIKSRILSSAQGLLVDMKTKRGEFEKGFRVLSLELEALIDKSKEDNERLFIFSARKGLSPTTICGDCGQVVLCKTCGSPIVLYSSGGKNFFKCNKCGETRDAMEKCGNCDSWKLDTLGIGIELVEREINKRFPDVKVFRMDKEVVKTEKKALEIITKFENTPGSVLLGTELALIYLKRPIENVAVASIDSLFALPDFRINEKMFYILLSLRSRAERVFIIQTRNSSEPIFDYAIKGSLADFYRDEIEDRKTFSYPPFSTFIKLSIEGRKPGVVREAENIAELFKDSSPNIFSGFSPSKRGNTMMNILIRVPVENWPDEKILQKIYSLPPQVAIRVDPESVL
jgi:primosomal protein N' (replication factor Y)